MRELIMFYGGSQDGKVMVVNELLPEINVPITKDVSVMGAEEPNDPSIFPEIKIEVYERDGHGYFYSEIKSDK